MMGTLLDLARMTCEADELERLLELVAAHYRCPPDEVELMKAEARKDPAGALMCFRNIAEREGLTERRAAAAVVRLRLVLEAEDGQRTEAVLEIPRGRYDGMRVLEAFERHHMAGTTRVVDVRAIEE